MQDMEVGHLSSRAEGTHPVRTRQRGNQATRQRVACCGCLVVLLLALLPGCKSSRALGEPAAPQIPATLQDYVGSFKDLGMNAVAFGHFRSDKLGSLEQVLRGPWEIDLIIAGWAEPETGAPAPAEPVGEEEPQVSEEAIDEESVVLELDATMP